MSLFQKKDLPDHECVLYEGNPYKRFLEKNIKRKGKGLWIL